MLNSIGFSEAFEYMLMNFLKEPFKKTISIIYYNDRIILAWHQRMWIEFDLCATTIALSLVYDKWRLACILVLESVSFRFLLSIFSKIMFFLKKGY